MYIYYMMMILLLIGLSTPFIIGGIVIAWYIWEKRRSKKRERRFILAEYCPVQTTEY